MRIFSGMAVLLEISAFEYVYYLLHNSLTPFEKFCRVYSHHFSLIDKFLWYMFPDDRGRRTEVGGRRSEVGMRKSERQMTEDR
jgi:hypothetical protein